MKITGACNLGNLSGGKTYFLLFISHFMLEFALAF